MNYIQYIFYFKVCSSLYLLMWFKCCLLVESLHIVHPDVMDLDLGAWHIHVIFFVAAASSEFDLPALAVWMFIANLCTLYPTANRGTVWEPCQLLQPEWRPWVLPTDLHYPASPAHQPESLTLWWWKSISWETNGLDHVHPVLVLLIRLQCQHQQCQQHWHGRSASPGQQSVSKPIHKHSGWAHGAASHPHPAAKVCLVFPSKEVSLVLCHQLSPLLCLNVERRWFVFILSPVPNGFLCFNVFNILYLFIK